MTTRMLPLSIVAALLTCAPVDAGPGGVSLPDLAIRETPDGLHLFVAARGGLFSGVVPRDARNVPITSLNPETPCGPIQRAISVAVRGSRLVAVTGDGTPAVVECNLETRRLRTVYIGEPLREPASLAIAADGAVAVLDRAIRGIVVFRSDARPTVVNVSPAPMMLRGDELGQLYVADYDARGMLPISLSETSSGGSRGSWGSMGAQQQGRPNTPFLSLSGEPASFAVYRDVFYVAETAGPLRAQLTNGRLSLEIPDVRPRIAAVAASRNFLATIDREAASIEILARPLPAGVVLDPVSGNPNTAWLRLLEYLGDKRLLTRDRVKVAPEDVTYEALLRRNGVLIKVDEHQDKVALQDGSTKQLFCILNPTLCGEGYSPSLPYVVIPQVAPQAVLQTETTQLKGKDVKSAVDERVLLASHRNEVTDSYLATRNASVAASLETELLRRKMVLATPMTDRLTAGTVIRIGDGREQLVGEIGGKCDGLAATEAKTSLISQLSAPAAALPPGAVPAGVQRAQLSVGTWVRSTLSAAALEKCRPPEEARDQYVIIESLAVMDVAFAAIGGTATGGNTNKTAPVRRAIGPFYVGYKAVSLSSLGAGVTLPVEPDRLKALPPAGTSAIWALSNGSFTLPVTRWRTDVLLPAAEFYVADGPLQKLQKEFRGMQLSPRERLERAALSTHAHAVRPFEAADVTETLKLARQGLVKAIKYEEQLALTSGSEDVYVGVVEDSRSVNLDHLGFVNDQESAWFELVDGTYIRRRTPPATPAAATLQRADVGTEHGTHVAGTIGGRRQPSLTLGMLPKTKLTLVPSNSASDLKTSIQDAYDQFVYLFSMSLGFVDETPTSVKEDLFARMQSSWKEALFIVAAGNDGADLNAVGASAPVSWASSLPNVLTVGATDDRGDNVLGHHTDDDQVEQKGSNFGSAHVDLLAPGQLVHSFGRDGFAFACGSSHAAPQVTATAAMLQSRINKPDVLRARLIYTADWKEQNFNKRVWGGLLNVRRAVFQPKSNVFIKAGPDATPHEIKPTADARVHIEGDIHQRTGVTTPFRQTGFPFNRVLRIESIGAGKHRIILLSQPHGVLTIVKGTIQGSIKCEGVKKADAQGQFTLGPDVPVNCTQGFPVGQIKDFVAATPAAVKFP